MPTHTNTHTPQSHLLHTHSPKPAPTVPHAANTMRHRLKIDGVTFIELMCEECFKKQRIQKINM